MNQEAQEHKKQALGDEAFRDSIATINKEGKRNWMYPKCPPKNGKLYKARRWVSFFFLVLLFGLPFVEVNNEPLFLFNVLERKFILFGAIFWPQDFAIFGLGMLTFILFIVLFTVIFGRVFCGWACPQTIFMEMIFRRIEYWIEGDANDQRKLNEMPWNKEKTRKKVLKNVLFFLIAFVIANAFLSYIIGVKQLFHIMRDPISSHFGGFVAIVIFSLAFYGVFARFREQACLIVCPYGRLQGVLLDRNSIVVAYDYVRGEPRGKINKKEANTSLGDCVACNLCVHVCPTGIDIRNGTQLECVNCTACIDACDEVMIKTGRDTGLIRYASEAGIADKKPLRITTRMAAYSAVLVVLLGVLAFLLLSRSDVDATVLRAGGQLFQRPDSTHVSNLYNLQIVNKTHYQMPINLRVDGDDGEVNVVGNALILNPESKAQGVFFIVRKKENIHSRKTKIKIGVYAGNTRVETVSTTFLGPTH